MLIQNNNQVNSLVNKIFTKIEKMQLAATLMDFTIRLLISMVALLANHTEPLRQLNLDFIHLTA